MKDEQKLKNYSLLLTFSDLSQYTGCPILKDPLKYLKKTALNRKVFINVVNKRLKNLFVNKSRFVNSLEEENKINVKKRCCNPFCKELATSTFNKKK